jgi:hypothetical protein
MAFDEKTIQAVWETGVRIINNDPNVWRKDVCGGWIYRSHYGNRNSEYGWEIDHISPGGTDVLSNLRPLQWQNNAEKSEGRLKCNVIASGAHNVRKP